MSALPAALESAVMIINDPVKCTLCIQKFSIGVAYTLKIANQVLIIQNFER